MPKPGLSVPWERPGWQEQVSAWMHDALAHHSIDAHGTIEQVHGSRWSIVLRLASSAGDAYCKATVPLPSYEPALSRALLGWRPDCVPRVLAADPERGWLLTLDGGVRLREVFRSDPDLRHWQRVLPLYASVQIDLASRVDDLLALSTPDRRPAAVAAGYGALVRDAEAVLLGRPGGLTVTEQRRLEVLVPRVEALSAELTASPVPLSLHHGDLHDGNILLRDGAYAFFDWGNACVAHPFTSLRTALKNAKYTFGLDDNAPELARLRDDYLEPWTRYASRPALLATVALAHRVGMLGNALTWQRVLAGVARSPGGADEPVARLLREFLAAETGAGQLPDAATSSPGL